MEMSRCAAAWIAPLLEDTQLRGNGQGRDAHASEYAWPPLLLLLSRMIDDPHCAPPGTDLAILLSTGESVSRESNPRRNFA